MNTEEMSTKDFLEQVRKNIVAFGEAPSITEILRRISSGRMTERQFAEAQRAGFSEVYPDMIQAFKAGYYFGCQGLDFLSCLMLTKDEVEADQALWGQIQGAAHIMGEEDVPPFPEIKEFYASRLLPKYEWRHAFLDGEKGLKKASDLTPQQRDSFVRAREAFKSASFRWGWKQVPTGAAVGKSSDIQGAAS